MTWHERIEAARKRGGFTIEDVGLADQWVTCACGEQDARIPRNGSTEHPGSPQDARLYRHGIRFYEAVAEGDIGAATKVLRAIEIRAAEVLAEVATS